MQCEVTREELSRFEAGEVDEERAARLEAHVAGCADCTRRVDALRRLAADLRRLSPVAPPPHALGAVRRALAAEHGASPREVMTLEEVAAFLRVTPDRMAEYVDDLPAFELAGRVLIRREKLIEWIERRERAFNRGRIQSVAARVLAELQEGEET